MLEQEELYQSVSQCHSVVDKVEAFCGFTQSCVKCDKCPKALSLESASAGAEDYTFGKINQ